MRCKGTTKKGVQCRIDTATGYCHYHIYQNTQHQASAFSKPKPPKTSPAAKPTKHNTSWSFSISEPAKASLKSEKGWIYVYRMSASHRNVHVLNRSKNTFEPLVPKNLWLRLLAKLQGREKRTLVKVGFTTKLPDQRVDQWRAQCGHPIEHVVPKRRKVKKYDAEHHGWQTQQAHAVEQQIHHVLRDRFGNGKVRCSGCKPGTTALHVEWFLVPAGRINEVFEVIEAHVVK